MPSRPSTPTSTLSRLTVVMALALVALLGSLLAVGRESRLAAQAAATLEATIFTFDGQEFVRTHTTLLTEAGTSAVNTTLDHDSPAYKALIKKQSYVGEVTVFGKHYNAQYAPLIDKAGRLTGALFVAVPT